MQLFCGVSKSGWGDRGFVGVAHDDVPADDEDEEENDNDDGEDDPADPVVPGRVVADIIIEGIGVAAGRKHDVLVASSHLSQEANPEGAATYFWLLLLLNLGCKYMIAGIYP